jgi:hypothetical protein
MCPAVTETSKIKKNEHCALAACSSGIVSVCGVWNLSVVRSDTAGVYIHRVHTCIHTLKNVYMYVVYLTIFCNFFVANAFIYFNTQTMHIKSFYTKQHCYVSLKTLYPGGIWTRVFSFLRRMRCPLRYAARACTLLSCLKDLFTWKTKTVFFGGMAAFLSRDKNCYKTVQILWRDQKLSPSDCKFAFRVNGPF